MRKTSLPVEELIQLYIDGYSVKELSEKYGKGQSAIYNILNKNEIKLRQKRSGFTVKNLDKELILSLYKNGSSASKIAKSLGCSHSLILDFLDKENIEKIDVAQLRRKYRSINEYYFDVIDSEDKAYFLGLLYADGNVRIVKYCSQITINLQERDKIILDKFSEYIFGTNVLKFRDLSKYGKKNQWVLTISNKRMCKVLESKGCTPKKSLTLQFPEWLSDSDLQKHFIRGYFDGDGSICCNVKNYHAFKFSIVSTLEFCKKVDEIINKVMPIHFTYDVRPNGITTIISVNGNRQIEKLLDWLYKDATIYLERKNQKYQELKRWIDDVDVRVLSQDRHVNQYS